MRKNHWYLKKEKKDENLDQPSIEASTLYLEDIPCETYFHMSPHRDWFVKYQPYSGGIVYLGDYNPIEIMGRRNIKVKLDDDRERKLCYVWHVLDLLKNFL